MDIGNKYKLAALRFKKLMINIMSTSDYLILINRKSSPYIFTNNLTIFISPNSSQ